jgi:DNA processing protein
VDALSRGVSPISEAALPLLILDGLPRVGPVTIRRLVERFGTADAALVAPNRDFAAVAGGEAARMRSDRALRSEAEAALRRAARLGMQVLTWRSADYPEALTHLADPPPVLFLRGRAELMVDGRPRVTVVGARRATSRARDVAVRLGRLLARAGATVVSGLALGVDGAVHEGTLRADGRAVAVLGTGADVVYPRANKRLFDAILERGLVVSEFAPGQGAAPHHFPRRNRVLAALSPTTVVVEAGRRSGSLITVDHALDLGRDVWAVPGPIDSSNSLGSNRLLGEGARALVAIEDFVTEVCGSSAHRPTQPHAREHTEPAARVLAALADDTLLVDELAAIAGLPAATALAILTTMELHGEVERMPGMRFRRAA